MYSASRQQFGDNMKTLFVIFVGLFALVAGSFVERGKARKMRISFFDSSIAINMITLEQVFEERFLKKNSEKES